MAQLLRTLAALAEFSSLFPSTHMAANNVHNSSSRGTDTLFWPLLALHNMYTFTYMQTEHS